MANDSNITMTENANEVIIYVNSNEGTSPKIEISSEWIKSPFIEIYKRALKEINSIVEINSQIQESQKESDNNNCMSIYIKEKVCYNNIVAFVGGRGYGKTSAMLTVASMLEKNTSSDYSDNSKNLLLEYPKISSTGFNHIGVIDPSHFSKNNNIVEVFVSKLFCDFKKEITKPDSKCKDYQIREVTKKFGIVFQNLKAIIHLEKQNFADADNIELLEEFSTSMKLRKNLQDLVYNYHDLIQLGKGFTLLIIDDLDLNTQHSSEMLDQISKYLIIPDVIILLAVDFILLKKMEFNKYFSNLSNRIVLDTLYGVEKINALKDELYEADKIATCLLQKYIPAERRLYLPSLLNPNKTYKIQYKDKFPLLLNKFIEVQIKNKLEIIISTSLNQDYYLYPSTLRELHQLIDVIMDLDNTNIYTSLNTFWDYLSEYWAGLHLTAEQINILRIIKSTRYEYLNRVLIIEIYKYLKAEKLSTVKAEKLMEPKVKHFNISLGDVDSALDAFKSSNDVSYNRFYYTIKLYYTIVIKQLMDTENSNTLKRILNGYTYNPDKRMLSREVKKYMRDEYKFSYGLLRDNYDFNDESVVWAFLLMHYFIIMRGSDYENRLQSNTPFYEQETSTEYKYARFSLQAILFYQLDQEWFDKICIENEIALEYSKALPVNFIDISNFVEIENIIDESYSIYSKDIYSKESYSDYLLSYFKWILAQENKSDNGQTKRRYLSEFILKKERVIEFLKYIGFEEKVKPIFCGMLDKIYESNKELTNDKDSVVPQTVEKKIVTGNLGNRIMMYTESLTTTQFKRDKVTKSFVYKYTLTQLKKLVPDNRDREKELYQEVLRIRRRVFKGWWEKYTVNSIDAENQLKIYADELRRGLPI